MSNPAERVLIVEDEPSTRLGLTELVRTWGFAAESAADGEEALQSVTSFRPSIIISDLVMPRMGGLDLLKALKADDSECTVVLLTAQGSVETAVEAIKEGAYDYLTKPIEPQRLKILLDKIVERQDTRREVKALRRQLREQGSFGSMIGSSASMRKVYQIVEQAAPTSASVLVWGESGTGKELLARGIHDVSRRRAGPFSVFDCSAVAPTLLEAELFGYVKGAFTGAVQSHAGVFEQAHGGTLFIDELGELPAELQPKLLRALEARQVRRIGASDWLHVDVRIVAATHRDLRARVAARQFREDLYYRLAVVEALIPPLRDRRDDIPLLVEHFLASQSPPRTWADLPPNAVEMLRAHEWPGNVRELRNTVARLILFPTSGPAPGAPSPSRPSPFDGGGQGGALLGLPLREAREVMVEQFERAYIAAKLGEHGGNVSRAAEAMGVSRQFLHRLLERYGIART
jgi:DNA-binding NtrC family response regulator